MVSFFDQKEEVLTVELTPYGKQQFAEGLFAPAYYAFYDSSIIYDSGYINLAETQNRTTNRITTETPKLKPNVRFSSTPGAVYSLLTSNDSSGFDQDKPYNANFARTLGNSDPNSSNLPSWKIQTLNISDAGFNEGVQYNLDNTIPQMSATLFIDYETLEGTGLDNEPAVYTLLASDSLFLNVEELNTLFKNNGNFDIEVYKSGSEGTMTSLGFINRDSSQGQSLQSQADPFVLANNLRGNNDNIIGGFPILDDKYVEFYLNLSVDTEISFISTPENSTLYKRSIDRTPEDPCDILDALPDGYDLG